MKRKNLLLYRQCSLRQKRQDGVCLRCGKPRSGKPAGYCPDEHGKYGIQVPPGRYRQRLYIQAEPGGNGTACSRRFSQGGEAGDFRRKRKHPAQDCGWQPAKR